MTAPDWDQWLVDWETPNQGGGCAPLAVGQVLVFSNPSTQQAMVWRVLGFLPAGSHLVQAEILAERCNFYSRVGQTIDIGCCSTVAQYSVLVQSVGQADPTPPDQLPGAPQKPSGLAVLNASAIQISNNEDDSGAGPHVIKLNPTPSFPRLTYTESMGRCYVCTVGTNVRLERSQDDSMRVCSLCVTTTLGYSTILGYSAAD
jgi:hypothetical protein